MKRAVFLDRDGTILEHVPYMTDPAQVRIAPGAVGALRRLRDAGYLLVVVSNQSLVARGMGTRAQADAVSRRMEELFAAEGIRFDAIKYSFDAPNTPNSRRKPDAAMLREAAGELDIDLAQSVMIGDDPRDPQAGRAAGCRLSILISPESVSGEVTAASIVGATELVVTLSTTS